MKRLFAALIGGCVAVALVATDTAALEGGALARPGDPLARASVAVGTLVSGGDSIGASRCTGVLIAPDLVLTAGHCVRGNSLAAIVLFYDGARPIASPQPVAAVARYDVVEDDVPSEYVGRLSDLSLDTAILRLATPVRGRRPISIARRGPPYPTRLRLAGAGLSREGGGRVADRHSRALSHDEYRPDDRAGPERPRVPRRFRWPGGGGRARWPSPLGRRQRHHHLATALRKHRGDRAGDPVARRLGRRLVRRRDAGLLSHRGRRSLDWLWRGSMW
jgi:hypothetical protein